MTEENVITQYVSDGGKVTPIVEMNNFHLINSLLKVSDILTLNPNGSGSDHSNYERVKDTKKALKDEVLKRMDNRPQEQK